MGSPRGPRRRRDQTADAGFDVPREYKGLADRLTRHFAELFHPAVRARHLHQLRELAAIMPPRPRRKGQQRGRQVDH